MTNRELQELLVTHDADKPVLFVRDPDDDLDFDPWEITAVESFEDVLLLTRRPNGEN